MKSIFTVFLLSICFTLSAQWSNTTNQFYDSLYMPVCTANSDQTHPMSLTSYPDSGTIVYWEDQRNGIGSNKHIYVQKFDKNGNQLWTQYGIPISSGTNNQQFTGYDGVNTEQDYRSRSFAATDSAGGFYITYTDDSIASFVWHRICVQHIKGDGSLVFAGAGYIVAAPSAGQGDTYRGPMLIPDDNKGFYISYIRNKDNDNIYVYCYKDEGGVMKSYGGGLVNYNGMQQEATPLCGSGPGRKLIIYPITSVLDYNIWPDLQGGCSVLMSMIGNTGTTYKMLAYNRAWKVKKASTVSDATYFPTGAPNTIITNYEEGQVDILYKFRNLLLDANCTIPNGGILTWTDDILLSNGFLLMDEGGFSYDSPKGATISTTGNINVELMAYEKRTITGNTPSDFVVTAIGRSSEIYDSVPYQRASNSNPLMGYNPVEPAQVDQLNNFSDTLIGEGRIWYDFSLAGGGGHFFASGLTWENDGSYQNERKVRLQHLSVERQTANSFAIEYKSNNKKGTLIGKEVSAGLAGDNVSYDFPLVRVNKYGNALFYIRELGRSVRVSPIQNGTELAWGAMGKPIGSGVYMDSYYSPNNPFVSLNASGGTGVICWQEFKDVPVDSRINISLRHLDSLNLSGYLPPLKSLKLIPNPFGGTIANPAVLVGSSEKYSVIEAYNPYGTDPGTSPVVEILDNYNLGNVQVNVFQNTGAIRKYMGKPYLDRNFTIKPENNPAGLANINVRLFFTTADFDALKAAEPAITDPGSLVVVKQPNNTLTVPAAYTPVSGEEVITPIGWGVVEGGYYIEIVVNSFSNFFIQNLNGALPVTWVHVEAQWQNNTNAKVSWQVVNQINVKKYNLQHSYDGVQFVNVCEVAATNSEYYSCIVPAEKGRVHYYRVLQTDIDGKSSLSKIVTLQSSDKAATSLYPNPATGQLFIKNESNYHEVVITDLSGKVLLKKIISGGLNTIQIDQIPAGTYFIRLTGDNESETKKLVKK